jgi:branched-subunit amino acid transport protein
MMTTTTAFLIILGMGAITYSLRVSMFLLAGRTTLPPYVASALRYVPAAVLSAIIAPELFLPNGVLDLSLGNARLIAGLVAIIVAWRTRNVLVTIAVGMLVLWLLQALGAGV